MARRRILVPVDFSTQSDLALEYARNIASSLDAMISCIYVIEEQGMVSEKSIGNDKFFIERQWDIDAGHE